jgi:hypothetical protein
MGASSEGTFQLPVKTRGPTYQNDKYYHTKTFAFLQQQSVPTLMDLIDRNVR